MKLNKWEEKINRRDLKYKKKNKQVDILVTNYKYYK